MGIPPASTRVCVQANRHERKIGVMSKIKYPTILIVIFRSARLPAATASTWCRSLIARTTTPPCSRSTTIKAAAITTPLK